MLIIPIDNLNKRVGILGDATPKLFFNRKGAIRLNMAAIKLMKLKPDVELYLHFYDADGTLYIKFDNSKEHGLRIKYREVASSASVCARNVCKYFFDLTKTKDEENLISFVITADDFGKYLLNKTDLKS